MEQSWAKVKVNCYRGELLVLYLYRKLWAAVQSVRVGTYFKHGKRIHAGGCDMHREAKQTLTEKGAYSNFERSQKTTKNYH